VPRGWKLGIGIAGTLFGILLSLAGLVLLAFVGVDGTFTTPRTAAETDTHAIVLSASFVDEDLRSGELGDSTVTLDVEGGDREVFLGIADSADVADYLDGVAVAQALEVSYPGAGLTLRRVDGRREPTPPEDEPFWTRSRVGDGTLTWDLAEGDWSVVVMNADGSAGLDVAGTVTARIPALGVALVVLLLIGVPLLVAGIALIVSGVRQQPAASRPVSTSAPPRPDR
jgi:hypothetical protein